MFQCATCGAPAHATSIYSENPLCAAHLAREHASMALVALGWARDESKQPEPDLEMLENYLGKAAASLGEMAALLPLL